MRSSMSAASGAAAASVTAPPWRSASRLRRCATSSPMRSTSSLVLPVLRLVRQRRQTLEHAGLAGVQDLLEVAPAHAPDHAGVLQPVQLLVRAHEPVQQHLALALVRLVRRAGQPQPPRQQRRG